MFHTQFGSALVKRWNLPDKFMHIARYHEDLAEADPISKALIVISVANLLVQQMGHGKTRTPLDGSYALKLLDIDGSVLDDVAAEVSRLMEETNLPTDSGA
jgi:HD-like signal output (HDOD) protein